MCIQKLTNRQPCLPQDTNYHSNVHVYHMIFFLRQSTVKWPKQMTCRNAKVTYLFIICSVTINTVFTKAGMLLTRKAAKGQRSPTDAVDKKQSNKCEGKIDKGCDWSEPYRCRCVLHSRHFDDCCTIIPAVHTKITHHQFFHKTCPFLGSRSYARLPYAIFSSLLGTMLQVFIHQTPPFSIFPKHHHFAHVSHHWTNMVIALYMSNHHKVYG